MRKRKLLTFFVVIMAAFILTTCAAFASSAHVDSKTYTHSSTFDNCIVIDGIDASYWQGSKGTLNWDQVKAAGIDYVFVRVGYTSTGSTFSRNLDSYFDSIMKGAQAAGLQVGVYYYSQATSVTEAQNEAQWVIDKLQSYSIDLPVVMDYEFISGGRLSKAYSSWTTSSRKSKMTANALTFLTTIKNAGYTPMFYSYLSMMNNSMDMSLIEGQYKIWMAQYNTSNSYGGKYEYWQYTSSGTVPGLIGAIDCNFWYYDNNAEATKDGTTSIKDASVSLSSTSFDYDASAHKPSISVTYAGMPLTEGTDYKVSYIKNVQAGTGYAMVRGIGAYSNVSITPFTINPSSITGITVGAFANKNYTGSEITPSPVVRLNGNVLTKGVDYTLSYSNNVNVGTGTVTITGIGNLSGSVNKTFRIVAGAPTFSGYSTYSRVKTSPSFRINTKVNSGGTLSYESSDSSIATVSSSGYVTFHGNAGIVYITVTAAPNGNYTSGTKKVKIIVREGAATITTGEETYDKTTSSKAFDLNAVSNSGGALTYATSDSLIATVDEAGIVTLHGKVGTATITITSAATTTYSKTTKTVTVNVTDAAITPDTPDTPDPSVVTKPAKQAITVSSPAAGKLRVYVTTDTTADGYQVRFSRSNDFLGYVHKYTIATGNAKYRTYRATSGKKYYVKARAFKTTESGLNVYGYFSPVQEITVSK